MRGCRFCGCFREPTTAPDPYTTDGTVEVCPQCNNAESYIETMDKWPKTMVFRQYGDDGKPLPNGYVVEREAYDQSDAQSYIDELRKLDYELESAIPTDLLDQEVF